MALPQEILDDLIIENNLAQLQSGKRMEEVTAAIDYLINHDFGKLIHILYRVDVSEARLKKMLLDQPNSLAASVVAELLIKRQIEKIRLRENFSTGDGDISEAEKW